MVGSHEKIASSAVVACNNDESHSSTPKE